MLLKQRLDSYAKIVLHPSHALTSAHMAGFLGKGELEEQRVQEERSALVLRIESSWATGLINGNRRNVTTRENGPMLS